MVDWHMPARMVAVTLTLASALILTACSGRPHAASPPSSLGTPIDVPMPAALQHMTLIDSSGHPVTLAAFQGKTVVLSDLLTLCQETCPVTTATLVQAAQAVDKAGLADKVEFVSITVDPPRDTPGRLAAYRKLFDPAPPNWITLTGAAADIDKLWNTLGIWRQRVADDSPPPLDWLTHAPLTYDVEHSDQVLFFDASAHDRFVLDGPAHVRSGNDIPSTLSGFMNAQGHRNIASPDAGAWTASQALQVIGWLTRRSIADD